MGNRSFFAGRPLATQPNDRNLSCLNNRSQISEISQYDMSAYASREIRHPNLANCREEQKSFLSSLFDRKSTSQVRHREGTPNTRPVTRPEGDLGVQDKTTGVNQAQMVNGQYFKSMS